MKYMKPMMMFALLSLSAVAQTASDEKTQKAIADTRAYIDKLAESVRPTMNNDDFPKPEDVKKAHAAINAAEDEFIAANIDPRHVDQKSAEKLIRDLDYHPPDPKELAESIRLFGKKPDEETGGLAYVFVSGGAAGTKFAAQPTPGGEVLEYLATGLHHEGTPMKRNHS